MGRVGAVSQSPQYFAIHPHSPRTNARTIRRLLLTLSIALTLAHAPGHATTATRALSTETPTVALPARRVGLDTVPPLTRAEARELRRLERRAELRRRSGEVGGDAAARPGTRRNGLAVASLVTGVVGIALALPVFLVADTGLVLLFGPLFAGALVFGVIAARRAKRRGRKHRGLAIAGMVFGIIGAAYTALLLLARATSDAG